MFVVAGSIYLTQAQRRIPVQQAKHMRGRRVYGGSKQYLPLRVNHAGVMPIIFASTLMMIPAVWDCAKLWPKPARQLADMVQLGDHAFMYRQQRQQWFLSL